ncbi:MAG: hypothetical protein HYX72_12685 [Acidobacteria bacterium]|nr:hypothetical protein [Acidobacteriota bacterium]
MYCGTHCRQRDKNYFYYHCWRKTRCKSRWVRRDDLENTVWHAIRAALLNPRLLGQRVAAATKSREDSQSKETCTLRASP